LYCCTNNQIKAVLASFFIDLIEGRVFRPLNIKTTSLTLQPLDQSVFSGIAQQLSGTPWIPKEAQDVWSRLSQIRC
jgi:hypothetical protein